MDKFNLKLYLEQVNHEADSTIVNKWEENEESALNNVIDPNTEFKPTSLAGTNISVTPSSSYGLISEPKVLKKEKLSTEQPLQECSLATELVHQFQTECLNRELEETLEGIKSRRARSITNPAVVPKVHGYTSTHFLTQAAISGFKMNNSSPSGMETGSLQIDPHNILYKYPPDSITVVTEKCSYLTKSSPKSKNSDHFQRPQSVTEKDKFPARAESSMSAASSHESVATASITSGQLHRKTSIISTHSLSNMNTEASCRLDRSTTTADQLAWEFRRARDRLETASNLSGCSSRFELESNYSERAETMSTISDVSGYEEEMFRIKRLLLLDSATPTPPPGKYEKEHSSTTFIPRSQSLTAPKENVEVQIHSLNVQLQNALTEKEKYRIDAVTAETKVALEWQDKYQEVLRQKAHMEGRLETVQSEMTVLLSQQKDLVDHTKNLEQELKLKNSADGKSVIQEMERLTQEINKLQQTVREVQAKNQDVTLHLELKDSEVSRWKEEFEVTEASNEKLRIELQELKIEAESKDGAIQGLKDKISDQHIEFQSLLQAKLKAENNLTSLKNEIESTKKSGYWYRDQLHGCQAAKVKVQQELMVSQANVVSQSHQIEKMKGEISNLQQVVEETQHKAVREKETLMRKLEVIQADILEHEAAMFTRIQNESTTDTINTIATKLKKIEEEKVRMSSITETTVQDLKDEILSLKNELKMKETMLENTGTENTNLMVRVTTLQKTLNEKELALQLLENKYKNIEMSYIQMGENVKLKEQTLLELKNEKVAMEVALAAAGREKVEVDEAVSTLKDDFARITGSYQSMKTELREKEKCIGNMQADLNELQRVKQNQIERINDLEKKEDEYRELRSRISQVEAMEQQLEHVLKVNKDLNARISEINEAHSYAKEQITKMEETISVREEQLVNQTQNFEVHREELKTKEQSLIDLQNEKIALQESNTKLELKIKELETTKEKLSSEIVSYKKQLSRANGAIDQFNLLCRKSEEEKNILEKKLKKTLIELENVKTQSAIVNGSMVTTESDGNGTSGVTDKIMLKNVSSYENGCVQTNLSNLYGLISNIESKLSLVLAEGEACLGNQISKEQTNVVANNNIIEIDSLFPMLMNANDSLKKVLEYRNKLIMEVQSMKQLNEMLTNELHDLKQVSVTTPLTERKRNNNISYGTQTDKIKIETTSSQTINDYINYKEQAELYQKEISRVKGSLRLSEIEHREKHRKYESNVRTLLKKVKEHMRGRKVAERALEELRGKTDEGSEVLTLRSEIRKMQVDLEASKKECEEQRKIVLRNQEELLVLEKERGKLIQSCNITKEKLPSADVTAEDSDGGGISEFDQKAQELQFTQAQTRITELEEELRKSHIIVKELRKEIFSEKCETSQLRKQISSLQMGLDTANDVLDTKKVELGKSESMCYVMKTKVAHLKKQLESEQQAHEECKQEMETLRETLEESRAKDPVLADQIKTLSYHLHQKTQEAAGLQEKIRLSEERWNTTEQGLQRTMSALQDELTTLRSELDSVRGDKFTFQTQAAELRAALHSSVEQYKVFSHISKMTSCCMKDIIEWSNGKE